MDRIITSGTFELDALHGADDIDHEVIGTIAPLHHQQAHGPVHLFGHVEVEAPGVEVLAGFPRQPSVLAPELHRRTVPVP